MASTKNRMSEIKAAAEKAAKAAPARAKAAQAKAAKEARAVPAATAKKTVPAKATKAAPKKTPDTKGLTERQRCLLEIKRRLLSQKDTLLSEAEASMNNLPEQTIFPDLGDQASVESDMNFLLRLRGREQRLLKKIDLAVEKIDAGAFGICDVCGEEIDIKRLQARPVTTMCIACKTEQEEEEKMMGQ